MMENLVKVCKELRRATLEAQKLGVINVSGLYNEDSKEQYQISEEKLFLALAKGNKITKKAYSSEYKWEYTVEVDGLILFIITNEELEI